MASGVTMHRAVGSRGRGPAILALVLLLAAGLQVTDRLVFARVPSTPLGSWVGGGEDAFTNPLLVATVVDVATLAGLTLLGGLLIPRRLALGAARPIVALLTGVSLQATFGLLLLPPMIAAPLLIGATVVAARSLRMRGLPAGWRRADAGPSAAALLILIATTLIVRSLGLVILSFDSTEYWEGARLLASGGLRPELLQSKRMLALQSLHAPGIAVGTDGVMTLGPILFVAAILLVGLAPTLIRRVHGERPALRSIMLGIAGATIVAASSWLWFSAIYLNVHLLVAVLLLGIVITALATGGGDLSPALPPLTLMVVAVVLARPEAALVVGSLLVGSLASERWREWTPAWFALGLALLAWNGLLLAGAAGSGGPPLVAVLGLLAGAAAVSTPTLLVRLPRGVRVRLPMALGGASWTTMLVLLNTSLGDRITFVEMARVNLGQGAGSWHLTAPLLLLLGAAAIAASSGRPELAPARWFLILFIPLTLLAQLADGSDALDLSAAGSAADLLLSGGGRPKWGDSVNRMWTHATLLVVALITLSPDRPALSPQRPGRRPLVASVGLVMSVAIVTAWWRPDLGPDGPPQVTVLVDTSPVRPGLELVAGANDSRTILLPTATTVPADARFVATCFDVVLEAPATTPAQGTFELAITAGGRIAREEFRGAAQADGAVKEVCLELLAPYPDEATAAIRGTSGESGRVVTVLATAGAGFVRSSTLKVDAPSLDPRSPLARAGSWTVRRLIQWGPTALGLGLSLVVLLPHRQRQGPRGVSPDR